MDDDLDGVSDEYERVIREYHRQNGHPFRTFTVRIIQTNGQVIHLTNTEQEDTAHIKANWTGARVVSQWETPA